jgi:hypothetical protein
LAVGLGLARLGIVPLDSLFQDSKGCVVLCNLELQIRLVAKNLFSSANSPPGPLNHRILLQQPAAMRGVNVIWSLILFVCLTLQYPEAQSQRMALHQ